MARAMEIAMRLEGIVCGGFTGDEREALIDDLHKVADNLGLAHGVHPAGEEAVP